MKEYFPQVFNNYPQINWEQITTFQNKNQKRKNFKLLNSASEIMIGMHSKKWLSHQINKETDKIKI